MRVLHVTPFFAPAWRYGGPVHAVLRLCQALQQAGVDVEVATTNADGARELPVPAGQLQSFDGVPVRYFRRVRGIGAPVSPALARYAANATSRFDLVHISAVFSLPALAAGVAARRAAVPYVVSPHGALQRYSLRQKRWKKAPYWRAFERPHLLRAAAIHVNSAMERDELAPLLPGARVFVLPNGVDEVAPARVPRHPRRIVFLGRIHPKKGFDVLVPALERVAGELPDVETVVAGADDVGEWARVERLLATCHPRPTVRYVGAVDGPARFDLLAGASAFVLPSHAENFGMTVVEAMACGTPVVVSRNCPWEEVERCGAGAWVENEPGAVAVALLRILRDPGAVERMGDAGRCLAAAFRWGAIGDAMRRHYEELARESSGQRRVAPPPR